VQRPVRDELDVFFTNRELQAALARLGVFAIDYGNRRSFASSVWFACGYTAEDMDDELFLERLHPDDKTLVQNHVEQLLGGERDHSEVVFRMRKKDDSWVWIAATYSVAHRDENGLPLLYLGHDQDVTAIKQAEHELRQRLVEIESLRQVIADVNTSVDLNETVSLILEHTRRVIPYQRSSVHLLKGDELEVIGCIGFSDRDRVLGTRFPHPAPGNLASKALQSRNPLICNNLPDEFPSFTHFSGDEVTLSWLAMPLIANNEVIGLLALDSTEPQFYTSQHLKLAELFAGHVSLAIEKARMFENIRHLAITDALTGAGNRHSLQMQGPFFFEKAKRDRRRLFALMVDIDFFKKVNDSFGHDVGDLLLKSIADLIRNCLRPYDLFFRYGGEEFLVLLPGCDLRAARQIAERIRQSVESECSEECGGVPNATVSVGLGFLVPKASMALSDLIKIADLALYQAKETGRNRVIELKG